jgi:hypothetical protein
MYEYEEQQQIERVIAETFQTPPKHAKVLQLGDAEQRDEDKDDLTE